MPACEAPAEQRAHDRFSLVAWVGLLIELTRLKWMMGGGIRWQPGEKLKLLFAGYNGTRNTGSDVRVNEMLRQIRHVLGAENVDFSVMTKIPIAPRATSKARGKFSCPMFFRRSSIAKPAKITVWSPAKAPCSKANSPTPSPP